MSEYVIIRGNVNAGKTTTSAMLFEKLREGANFAKIYSKLYKEIETYVKSSGEIRDFIGVVVIGDFVIIIISEGDIAENLQETLDKLNDIATIKELTNGKTWVNVFVCCARSKERKGSTLELLYNRVPQERREEFWTIKSENSEDKFSIKEDTVTKITDYILSKMK